MTRNAWESSVRTHFDLYSASYGGGYGSDNIYGYFFRTRQKIVEQLLQDIQPGRLLDVGCGPGVYAPICIEKKFRYVGIDLSREMVASGQAKCAGSPAHFANCRMQSLPFPNSSFDVVLCLGAMEYIQKEEQPAAILELARVMKPGGLVIFSCINKLSPYRIWGRTRSFLSSTVKGREPAPNLDFTAGSFAKGLQGSGLRCGKPKFFAPNVFLTPLEHRLPGTAVSVMTYLERFSNGLLSRLGWAFLLIAEKPGGAAH